MLHALAGVFRMGAVLGHASRSPTNFKNNEGNIQGYKNDIVWTYIEVLALEIVDEEEDDDE